MTVQQLMDRLKVLPPGFEVWLSKDEEGNGFDTLFAVETGNMEDYKNNMGPDYNAPHDSVILWP